MTANLFDANFYRLVNPDLAGLTDEQARQHLLVFGLEEGRQFSPYVDLNFYKEQYPDLAAAGLTSNRQIYDHLENFGVAEGRIFSTVFNTRLYGSQNEDLRVAGLGNEQLFEHFQNFGINEGRQASTTFDVSFYLDVNPDLVVVGLSNRQALEHFRTLGINEGRASSRFFNAGFYRQTNPDLRQAGFNNQQALEHYLRFGILEGRPGEPPYRSGLSLDTGVLGDPKVFRDWVGRSDLTDSYRFSLDTNSEVNIKLDWLRQIATLSLISPDEGDLVRNQGSVNNPVEIREILPPGTYLVEVEIFSFLRFIGTSNSYNLSLSATPSSIGDRAGNTVLEARDLGVLNNGEERLESDLVWSVDPEDFYRFSLDAPSKINVSADLAEFEIIQDLNNNGAIEANDTLISRSTRRDFTTLFAPFTIPAIIDNLSLLPGTYFIRVTQSPDAPAQYELRASAESFPIPPDNAGNTLSEASNVDVLTGNRVVSDFVGEIVDDVDFYRFTLDRTADVSIALEIIESENSSVVAGATDIAQSPISFPPVNIINFQLIEDFNNNGIVDEGEAIASQTIENFQTSEINEALEAGTYFVGIEAANINTDYTLNFSS